MGATVLPSAGGEWEASLSYKAMFFFSFEVGHPVFSTQAHLCELPTQVKRQAWWLGFT